MNDISISKNLSGGDSCVLVVDWPTWTFHRQLLDMVKADENAYVISRSSYRLLIKFRANEDLTMFMLQNGLTCCAD